MKNNDKRNIMKGQSKKYLFSILLCLMVAVGVYAAKSNGGVRKVVQPDGTTLSIQLLGDENFCWYQTIDGVLLIEESKVFYVGQVTEDGELQSSGIVAHNSGSRSSEEQTAVSKQDKNKFFSKANDIVANSKKAMFGDLTTTSISGYPVENSYCPHSGTITVPIIMMAYSDTPFVFDKATFEEYFNGTTCTNYSNETRFQGYSSVAQYFHDASDGKLNFKFELYGPYTAAHEHDYYGIAKGKSREQQLLSEAVKNADNDVDFSDAKFDSNNDGNIDMVYVLYAGCGANISHDNNDFWPACWYSSNKYYQGDGKNINVIGGANELAIRDDATLGSLRAGIGVTCHEMSHGLGLPDLYWNLTTVPKNSDGYEDYNNCGPEDWDLMDGGENLYNGIWPCQYAAWEKDVMGWLDVEDLTEPADVTLYPLNKEGGSACRVTNPQNAKEYYIIENYQYDGWNEVIKRKYGSGLMITHLNASSNGFTMSPNNTYGKPNITLLPADGFILGSYEIDKSYPYHGTVQTITEDMFKEDAKGDPYYGSAAETKVTSVAAYNNYTGPDMVDTYPITDIVRNDDGSISFKFMGGKTTPTAMDIVKDHNANDNSVRKYIRDGKVIIFKNGCEYTVSGEKLM